MKLYTWIVIILFLNLTGCGNGGGSSQSSPSVEPVPAPIVVAPIPTVADGGDDQAVELGQSVTLQGKLWNAPQDEALEFKWTIQSAPPLSVQKVLQQTVDSVTWEFDTIGFYVIQLSVNGRWTDTIVVEIKPNPHTFSFFFMGTYGTDGTVEGTFSYDNRVQPIGTNIRGLVPNNSYQMASWRLTAQGGGMPTQLYESGKPLQSVEFCQGQCIVGKSNTLTLTFKNESTLTVQLIFENMEPLNSVAPTNGAAWGPWIQGVYRVGCLGCVPVAVITTGHLTEL